MSVAEPRRGGHPFGEGGSAVVVGFAVTGQAAARVLLRRGCKVVAVDDTTGSHQARAEADALGVQLVEAPSRGQLRELTERADLVVLSPGIPPSHAVFEVTDAGKIVSEVELGGTLASVPIVAVTGTNGKTTVTSLVAAMLQASGLTAEAVGNIGRPFIEAAEGPADVFVLEVSSFQLAWTSTLRPAVACWLNLADDHLDWHADLEDYARAKARIFANQHADDVTVANADDPIVMSYASESPGRLVTFGQQGADYTERAGELVGPEGVFGKVSELWRSLPHDRANALAAAACALAAGATLDGVHDVLVEGVPMPHRIELVGEVRGVQYFDDSKATTPSAVVAALTGFDSVVLIAGGRNKGLDLGAIRRGLEADGAAGGRGTGRLRGVVAVGEAEAEIVDAFAPVPGLEVARAGSMTDAVAAAERLAAPGDAVVLSPGCASFDWYRSYAERGDDFARVVRALPGGHPSGQGEGSR